MEAFPSYYYRDLMLTTVYVMLLATSVHWITLLNCCYVLTVYTGVKTNASFNLLI